MTCIEGQRRVRPKGVNWRPCLLSQLFLIEEETRVTMSIYHDRKQAAGEECLVMPQEKERKDMPMERTLKIYPMTCLLLGWWQDIQCFSVVTTRFSSPSLTRWGPQGEAVIAGEKSSHSPEKTLTWQDKQGKLVTQFTTMKPIWGRGERRMSMHHLCPCFLSSLTRESLQGK